MIIISSSTKTQKLYILVLLLTPLSKKGGPFTGKFNQVSLLFFFFSQKDGAAMTKEKRGKHFH
jgi:hypothetical protein